MITQATLAFTATASPNVLPANLASALGAVTLPESDLLNFGLVQLTDNTTTGVGTATRTIVFSTLPPFVSNQNPGTINGGNYISVVSSSPADGPGGNGALVIQIAYNDPNGKPKTVQIALNGTTPVSPPPRDVSSSLVITVVEGNPNVGLITVTVGQNGKGPAIAQLLGNFQGSIVSSSNNDALGDIGAHTVQVIYHDKTGAGPFTENINLNGQTPVNFTNLNHATINSMQPTATGSYGATIGSISLFSGLNATGALVAQLTPSFFGMFPPQTVVAPGLDIKGNIDFGVPTGAPSAADQITMLQKLYTMALSAGVGSIVSSATPVLS